MASAIGHTVAPFLSKIYEMVDDQTTNSVVSWSSSNNSFVVWNVPEFQRDLLPKYFKHSNFSSFVRQLNTYGFKKVDPDRFEFANEGFLRGQKHLLKSITRKKPAQVHNNQSPQVQSSSVAACVEVGKFGLEEEVERLKRDKNVLMQELVRLRQQQLATDHQLQTVGQRVQVMEQRQQQMMSFLAKAMQSPGFLSQLVKQQNESSRCISVGSKKRRLPGQEEENLASENGNNSPSRQIVKFHPSMNEAAKAYLQQILKMNTPPRLEPSMNNSGPFLLGNLPSSSALENNGTSSRFSAVTLSEVHPASGPPSLPVESQFSVGHPSTATSDVQFSPCMLTDNVKINSTSELNEHNSRHDTILLNFNEMQGFMPESSVGIPSVFGGSESGNAVYSDSTSPVFDSAMHAESDTFSPDQDVLDISVDNMQKLPGINDVFWEQFLGTSPTGNTDEINSSSPESSMTKEQEFQSWQENGWDKLQNMNHITDKMGLLTSESRRM